MLFAQLQKGTDPDTVRKEVARVLPGAIVSSADNIGGMMKGFSAISGTFATTMGILSLVFAAIVTYRILSGSMTERALEIGIMKAVGWTRNDVTLALVTETLIVGLLGGLVGVALGYMAALGLGSLKISLTMPWNLNPFPQALGTPRCQRVFRVFARCTLLSDRSGLARCCGNDQHSLRSSACKKTLRTEGYGGASKALSFRPCIFMPVHEWISKIESRGYCA